MDYAWNLKTKVNHEEDKASAKQKALMRLGDLYQLWINFLLDVLAYAQKIFCLSIVIPHVKRPTLDGWDSWRNPNSSL